MMLTLNGIKIVFSLLPPFTKVINPHGDEKRKKENIKLLVRISTMFFLKYLVNNSCVVS